LKKIDNLLFHRKELDALVRFRLVHRHGGFSLLLCFGDNIYHSALSITCQPMSERLPRKLAAILYADVAGYSRLTGKDEDGTHRMLRASLDLIAEKIRQHDGRVVHYAGDAVLADFGTVVDALTCATAIQLELDVYSADVPEDRQIRFRIGVNLGDVIVDGEEIYGDGVNVAARLESLAEPGGVCISDAVRTAVGRKLGYDYEDMGAQEVKNIEEPVRSYHVCFREGEERPRHAPTTQKYPSATSVPTVLVTPFRFIGDPGEHEYVAAAMTESVGSALTHFRDYRIVEADESEDATYVLGGTLQIAGSRIRISLQLSDGVSGHKLWAEKIDRKLEDVFDLQDEISAIVAAYLGEAIWQETARKLAGKSKDDYNALDWSYYAMEHIHRLDEEGFREAKAAAEKSMSLDPELLLPKFILAFTLAIELNWRWCENEEEDKKTAVALTDEVLRKDPMNANSHRLAARLYTLLDRHDDALVHSERSITLNPFDGDVLAMHGLVLAFLGRAEEAVPWVEKAMRYNPQPPRYYRQIMIQAQYMAGDHGRALENLRRVEGELSPMCELIAVAVFTANGRHDEAVSAVNAIRQRDPGACVESVLPILAQYKEPAQRDAVVRALVDAGLPEKAV
jgi:adenylate cyclase